MSDWLADNWVGGDIFNDMERRRVKHGFDQLREQLHSKEDAKTEALRVAARSRIAATGRNMILRQYAAMGIEPIYGGDGLLISPTLAAMLGHHGLHRRHGYAGEEIDDQ